MKLLTISCLLALCLVIAYADLEAEGAPGEEPSTEYLPPTDEEPETKVAEDGYRYKTIRRLKYRHRREVSQEYLPPPVEEPNQEYLPPDNSIDTKFADDGYRYKAVRRFKVRRHRRDISELAAASSPSPSNEYLPPVDVLLAPELKTEVGQDGYRYKTVRRLKYRRHRREAEAAAADEAGAPGANDAEPAKDYLPPAAADAPAVDVPAPTIANEVKSAELAKDGYRYKTVRRIRYRYRQ